MRINKVWGFAARRAPRHRYECAYNGLGIDATPTSIQKSDVHTRYVVSRAPRGPIRIPLHNIDAAARRRIIAPRAPCIPPRYIVCFLIGRSIHL